MAIPKRATGSNQYKTRQRPDCGTPTVDLMAQADGPRVRCGDVWGTRCRAWVEPLDYLHASGGHQHGGGLMAAARNPQCDPEVLIYLATHADRLLGVDYRVAANPSCPPAALRHLAEAMRPPHLLEAVARNRNCPPDTLRRLAGATWMSVHIQVAGNPKCPVDVLARFLQDQAEDVGVRRAALGNPNLPEEYRQLGRVLGVDPGQT